MLLELVYLIHTWNFKPYK